MFHFNKSNLNNELKNSSSKISKGIMGIFTGKKLDDNSLTELEELLITSDLSIGIVCSILNKIKKLKFEKDTNADDVKNIISEELLSILYPCEKSLNIDNNKKPFVILFAGVNGSGKTTVIGKLAKILKDNNKKVLLGACDTFRAGALEQLKIWAEKSNVDIIGKETENEDVGSVVYKTYEKAKKENYDIVLIDTAGRLQNNNNLMDELGKIDRVLKKFDNTIPDETIMVLDATIGQNSKKQIEIFSKVLDISGIIINKLDGTSKGGSLISIASEFKKPIYAIGVGESIDDLREFNAKDFINNLLEI